MEQRIQIDERKIDIMMELSKRIEELLEENDFTVCGEITERYNDNQEYDIELEIYSPEGEDVIIPLIYDGTEESFINAFVDYANGFDAEEHAEMWIDGRGSGGVPGSIQDLLDDAEWIKEKLEEVADLLVSFDLCEENTDSFTQEELFILSDGILALIDNAKAAKRMINSEGIHTKIDIEISRFISLNSKICKLMEEQFNMTNILLNDGEIVTISSYEDAIDIIGEKISYELANYLKNHIVDADVEYEQYCEYMNKLEHDVNAYVMENDKLQKENEEFSRKISDLEFELKYLKEKTETEESFLPF